MLHTVLTAAGPVPDLHAVLLLRDGVDAVVGLAAVPVVVVIGGAIRPLKVTLLQGTGRGRNVATAELPTPRHPWPRAQAETGARQLKDMGRMSQAACWDGTAENLQGSEVSQ